MITLAQESLLDKTIQTLNVLLINDFCQDSESVSLNHVIVTLLDIFGQARDDDKDFVLIDLKLFDEDVHEAS